MKDSERDEIIRLYDDRFAEHGYGTATLGWRGVEDQQLRFEVLCDIADLSGARICDVGCGFGDLAAYLEHRFSDISYVGVDITPSLIKEAKQRRPELEFHCVDILQSGFDLRADYFLLSGALNYRFKDNWGLTTTMISKMWEQSNKGVAVNFLSSYVNFVRPHNYHHKPEDVFGFARSLTKRVALRHDYPLWEFTAYLYRAIDEAAGN